MKGVASRIQPFIGEQEQDNKLQVAYVGGIRAWLLTVCLSAPLHQLTFAFFKLDICMDMLNEFQTKVFCSDSACLGGTIPSKIFTVCLMWKPVDPAQFQERKTLFYRDSIENRQFGGQKSKSSRGELAPPLAFGTFWPPPPYPGLRQSSRELWGILRAALEIAKVMLGMQVPFIGMASHDLSNTKATILRATRGAIPKIDENPHKRFSFPRAFSEPFSRIGVVPTLQINLFNLRWWCNTSEFQNDHMWTLSSGEWRFANLTGLGALYMYLRRKLTKRQNNWAFLEGGGGDPSLVVSRMAYP